MRIAVTAQDIRRGKRAEPCRCPVALALKRTFKRKVRVTFTSFEFESYRKGTKFVVRDTPTSVAKFVEAFDDRKPVKPFSFSFAARGL